MAELFLNALNRAVSAGWLVLAVLILRLLLYRAPRWTRPLLWAVVGLRLALPFSLQSVLSLVPSAETVRPDIMLSREPAIHSGVPALDKAVNPAVTASFAPAPAASMNPLQLWVPVAAALWLAVIFVMLLYAAVSWLRLRRRMRTAVLLENDVWQSEYAASPFVLGLFRPKVYLPFGLDGDAASLAAAHERAHLRRRDHWWKPLGFLLLAAYWFQPLLWLAYILFCRDLELACDERVIRDLDPARRADYSETLLRCSARGTRISVCPLAFGEVGVKARVKRVLRYRKPALWRAVLAVEVCIVLAVCFLTDPVRAEQVAVAPLDVPGLDAGQDYHVFTDEQFQELLAAAEPEPSEEPEPFVPTREEVLAAREKALAGMSEAEINSLTEHIKAANLRLEHAYFYENIFKQLSDPDSYAWNYFEQTGLIQIGVAYGISREQGEQMEEICEREGLTRDEFYVKYGVEEKVVYDNDYDAERFAALIGRLRDAVREPHLRADLQAIIDDALTARDTHDMYYANDMYKRLHDMDYFLLRHGLTDVGPYVEDASTLALYYGTLSIYEQ